jgi:hypothetical protein
VRATRGRARESVSSSRRDRGLEEVVEGTIEGNPKCKT